MEGLVGRLRAVAARQASYAQRYELMHDSRAIFIETCSRMTALIADELPKRSERRYATRIEPDGLRVLSFVPLLCKGWTVAEVVPAGRRVESRLTCGWAEVEEHVERIAP